MDFLSTNKDEIIHRNERFNECPKYITFIKSKVAEFNKEKKEEDKISFDENKIHATMNFSEFDFFRKGFIKYLEEQIEQIEQIIDQRKKIASASNSNTTKNNRNRTRKSAVASVDNTRKNNSNRTTKSAVASGGNTRKNNRNRTRKSILTTNSAVASVSNTKQKNKTKSAVASNRRKKNKLYNGGDPATALLLINIMTFIFFLWFITRWEIMQRLGIPLGRRYWLDIFQQDLVFLFRGIIGAPAAVYEFLTYIMRLFYQHHQHKSFIPAQLQQIDGGVSEVVDVLNNECIICLENLSNPIFTLECNHRYHVGCIHNWFIIQQQQQEQRQQPQQSTCPNCRRIIRPEIQNQIIVADHANPVQENPAAENPVAAVPVFEDNNSFSNIVFNNNFTSFENLNIFLVSSGVNSQNLVNCRDLDNLFIPPEGSRIGDRVYSNILVFDLYDGRYIFSGIRTRMPLLSFSINPAHQSRLYYCFRYFRTVIPAVRADFYSRVKLRINIIECWQIDRRTKQLNLLQH